LVPATWRRHRSRMDERGAGRPLAVLFLAAFAVFSGWVKLAVLRHDETQQKLHVGAEAPALQLRDVNGARVDLQEVAGRKKVALVPSWATWCGPCRIELPELEKLYAAKRDAGLEILAVNEDLETEKLTDYLKERSLSFPVLRDPDGKVAQAYGVDGFPTTVL